MPPGASQDHFKAILKVKLKSKFVEISRKNIFFAGFPTSPAAQPSRMKAPGVKKSKIFGMVRDALGGVRGSSLSIFTGFSKDFEKLKIRKLKIGRNRFKMG